jgi:diaminopimelate decarboxylase
LHREGTIASDGGALGPYLVWNARGHLEIDGCDSIDLADRFGLPMWVISERTIRANYRRIARAFTDRYPGTRIVYASKANPHPAIMAVARSEGALVDAVTLGHLVLATRAGYPGPEIVFNGNSKTAEELNWALDAGIGWINVDSVAEMELLAQVQARAAQSVAVCLRLASDPGAYPDDPQFAASQAGSKFGLDEDDLLPAIDIARRHPGLRLVGLHNHIGWPAYGVPYSKALDLERHRREAERVVDFAVKLAVDHQVQIRYLNLGGGYRVGRPEGFGPGGIEECPTIEEYAEAVAGAVARGVDDGRLSAPQLLIEPGGYLVADAGVLLARVGSSKRRHDGEHPTDWRFVEGTSAYHFVRRLMYDFKHVAVAAGKGNERADTAVSIAGPVCTTDTLAADVTLPELDRGDVLAFLDQGAYCESIGSEYCVVPLPQAAMACAGEAAVIRRRQTLDEIAGHYQLTPWAHEASDFIDRPTTKRG